MTPALCLDLVPIANAFTQSFMFSNRETGFKMLDGEVGQTIVIAMEEFNLKVLGFPTRTLTAAYPTTVVRQCRPPICMTCE